ncbi:MAG TPA: nitroreductase [Acidimicrobiales bacterium]|nr:nitroreductase [Acidimicrobiales bacterium]
MAARRSIGRLSEPAPDDEELRLLIAAAAAAPDHGRLRPSRFIALRGANKDAFGDVLEQAYRQRCAAAGVEPDPAAAQKERTKLGRAPLVVVAATTRPEPDSPEAGSRNAATIPWDERKHSTAAAVQNLLLATTSLGYGSMWRTGDPARDSFVKEALGLEPEAEIIGFIYIGTPPEGGGPPPHALASDGLLTEWQRL